MSQRLSVCYFWVFLTVFFSLVIASLSTFPLCLLQRPIPTVAQWASHEKCFSMSQFTTWSTPKRWCLYSFWSFSQSKYYLLVKCIFKTLYLSVSNCVVQEDHWYSQRADFFSITSKPSHSLCILEIYFPVRNGARICLKKKLWWN